MRGNYIKLLKSFTESEDYPFKEETVFSKTRRHATVAYITSMLDILREEDDLIRKNLVSQDNSVRDAELTKLSQIDPDLASQAALMIPDLSKDDSQHPILESIVRDSIAKHVHPEFRDNFFSSIEKPFFTNRYMDGVFYELMYQAITNTFFHHSMEISMDEFETKLLWGIFKKHKPHLMMAQSLGMNFILKKLSKAAENLTDAINLDQIKRAEFPLDGDFDEKSRFFKYISKPEYVDIMVSAFGERAWQHIEERNFKFTRRTIELLPIICYGNNVPRAEREGRWEHIPTNGLNSPYYFAMLFPKIPLTKKTVSLSKGFIEYIKTPSRFYASWKDYKESLNNEIRHFYSVRDLAKEQVSRAISTLGLLGEIVGEDIYSKYVKQNKEDLEHILSDIKKMEVPELDIVPKINIFTNVMGLSQKIEDSYAQLAEKLYIIKDHKHRLKDFQSSIMISLAQAYSHAKNKTLFRRTLISRQDKMDIEGHSNKVRSITEYLCACVHDSKIYQRYVNAELIEPNLFDPDQSDIPSESGLYHDSGKILIPVSILKSKNRLSGPEWIYIKEHSIYGNIITQALDLPKIVQRAALEHHEKADGSGYPYGLKGDEIHPMARIVAAADTIDAMIGNRPYEKHRDLRDNSTFNRVYKELLECSGGNSSRPLQFDPTLNQIFRDMQEMEILEKFYKGVPYPEIRNQIKYFYQVKSEMKRKGIIKHA